jgi:hypothetical protein
MGTTILIMVTPGKKIKTQVIMECVREKAN